jgi:KaiC/GvpD/RAD55 family RecA-like ATPase
MAKKKAAKKKAAAAAPAPEAAPQVDPSMMAGMQPGMMPGMQPGQQPQMMPGQPQMMPGQMPGGQVPGAMPQMGMPAAGGGNPMMAMMQMMQMMAGGGGGAMMADPSAMPFTVGQEVVDDDQGLDADIIRPSLLDNLIKEQNGVPLGSALDLMCLTSDGANALGGIPQGCTIAFAGPPGKGKTRTALAGLAKVAMGGDKVALVVAEEGFHDPAGNGRDDLCSRMVKIGMDATGLDEKEFVKQVLDNVYVLESQYHKGQTWDDFVTKYRYLVEQQDISFVVIDSLNMLDPSRNRTADNLSALKTYNHERGITCLCIGQIRDTGAPVGGEALQHTADVVYLIEEMSMASKDMAETWGSTYREKSTSCEPSRA